jgi:hypothetical protein
MLTSSATGGEAVYSSEEIYAAVYQIAAHIREYGVVFPGVRGKIYHVIDQMRQFGAQHGHIDIVERMSAAIHELEWALLRQDTGRIDRARLTLCDLAEMWMATPAPRT